MNGSIGVWVLVIGIFLGFVTLVIGISSARLNHTCYRTIPALLDLHLVIQNPIPVYLFHADADL